MRLKTKLLVLFASTSVVIVFAFGGIIYNRLWNERLILIQESISQQLQNFDFSVKNFFSEVEGSVSALADNERVRFRDDSQFTSFLQADEKTFKYNSTEIEKQIIGVFNTYRLTHRYVNSVYMGRENGSFIRSHPREHSTIYDPRERPWYILAKANPGIVMKTDAYPSLTTSDINIGVVKALSDGSGTVYGVVGIDVTLVNLTSYILHFKVHPDGKIFLLDPNGMILAGHENGLQGKMIKEYSPELSAMLMKGNAGILPLNIRGRKNFIFYQKSAEQDWKIAVIVSAADIEGQIRGSVLGMVLSLSAGLALLSLLTLAGLNLFVIRHLKKLTRETDAIAQTGNLERRIDITSRDEIGDLADSFNKMIGTLIRENDERREAKKALHESERKYRELVEHANSIILRWNSEGRITFLNEFGQRFFGYSTGEIIGRNIIGTIVPATETDGRDLCQLMDQICADPIAFEQNINENMRRNGERVWISWTNKIVRDSQGHMAEIFSIGTDITERKRAEEAIRELNANLEQRVAERTAELAARNTDLERFNRLFVDRELRMKELKQRIKELEGRSPCDHENS